MKKKSFEQVFHHYLKEGSLKAGLNSNDSCVLCYIGRWELFFTLSKTIISDFWTQFASTHTALYSVNSALYTVICTLYTVHSTLLTVHCNLTSLFKHHVLLTVYMVL